MNILRSVHRRLSTALRVDTFEFREPFFDEKEYQVLKRMAMLGKDVKPASDHTLFSSSLFVSIMLFAVSVFLIAIFLLNQVIFLHIIFMLSLFLAAVLLLIYSLRRLLLVFNSYYDMQQMKKFYYKRVHTLLIHTEDYHEFSYFLWGKKDYLKQDLRSDRMVHTNIVNMHQ